jgi:hypothetical protein
MKILSHPHFLAVDSTVVATAFAVTLLCSFAGSRNQSFDVLTVHRIDFVEPDGTPRLISSNREQFFGTLMRKKEYLVPTAATPPECFLLSDEGSEMGGLIFGGVKE